MPLQASILSMRAFKRLFLILFPLSLLSLALFLFHKNPNSLDHPTPSSLLDQKSAFGFWDSSCPFYFGLSFFPVEEKKQNFFKKQEKSVWTSPLLSKQKFIQVFQYFKKEFQQANLSFKKVLFVFPLILTKDEQWIISRKTFLILPTGEKKKMSHLVYSEIQELHRILVKKEIFTPLKLKDLFFYLPNKNFLFYLEGSRREKITASLDKNFRNKTKGEIYLFSSNEKLLREILAIAPDWKILHSFKTLLRFQMISAFQPKIFRDLPGQGLIIPPFLTPSSQTRLSLKNQKKLLFFEKDPPYNFFHQDLIQSSQALISSQPKRALSIVQSKKPCFMRK